MALTIRYQGGKDSGKVLQFGDEVQSISFGRDASRCKVAFGPDEVLVGREHFAIHRITGRYRLMLDQEHVVLVNGKDAYHEQELPPEADVQLGRGGPVLVIQTRTAAGDMLPTVGKEDHRPGAGTMISEAQRRGSRGLAIAALCIVAVVLLAVIGYSIANQHSLDLAQQGSQITNQQNSIDNTRKGLESATQKLESNAQVLESTTQSVQKIVADLPANARQFTEQAARSVYMVVMKKADGSEAPDGTAWVVAKGILATNSHVAELFGKDPSEQMLVRSNSRPARSYKITKVKMHPGYKQFADIISRIDPAEGYDNYDITPLKTVPACDVALLYVDNDKDLDPPLPMASDEELQSLHAEEDLYIIGYPVENVIGTNVKLPEPTINRGAITRQTDYLMNSHNLGQLYLIQHNLPSAGGASGSPILNRSGKVVAVHSAGNFYYLRGTGPNDGSIIGRIPLPVGVNFAQRVDLVKELLTDTADDAMVARAKQWEQAMNAMPKMTDRYINYATIKWLGEGSGFHSEVVTQTQGQLTGSERFPNGTWRSKVKIDRPGDYLLVVITDNGRPMTFTVPQPPSNRPGPRDQESAPSVMFYQAVSVDQGQDGVPVNINGQTPDDDKATFNIYVLKKVRDPATRP